MKWLVLGCLIGSSIGLFAEKIPVKLTDERKVLGLYQVMKDMHELFGRLNIDYWIDSGTLLGAVRHKGLIPWDTDIDVCMLKKDASRLDELGQYLKKLGYTMVQAPFGWTIKQKGCCFDIFVVTQKQDRYIYADKHTSTFFAKRDGGPVYITHDELFPLKLYPFGDLEVWGPSNPIPYLDAYYKNWSKVAKFQTDHRTNSYSSKTLNLAATDKVPAQPLGPLEDRISKLFE